MRAKNIYSSRGGRRDLFGPSAKVRLTGRFSGPTRPPLCTSARAVAIRHPSRSDRSNPALQELLSLPSRSIRVLPKNRSTRLMACLADVVWAIAKLGRIPSNGCRLSAHASAARGGPLRFQQIPVRSKIRCDRLQPKHGGPPRSGLGTPTRSTPGPHFLDVVTLA